nr:hypothetical protein [Mesorhizobium wenxiniae]
MPFSFAKASSLSVIPVKVRRSTCPEGQLEARRQRGGARKDHISDEAVFLSVDRRADWNAIALGQWLTAREMAHLEQQVESQQVLQALGCPIAALRGCKNELDASP